jgi:hypothetical protein
MVQSDVIGNCNSSNVEHSSTAPRIDLQWWTYSYWGISSRTHLPLSKWVPSHNRSQLLRVSSWPYWGPHGWGLGGRLGIHVSPPEFQQRTMEPNLKCSSGNLWVVLELRYSSASTIIGRSIGRMTSLQRPSKTEGYPNLSQIYVVLKICSLQVVGY